jgi:hypothetical protein
LVYYSSPENAAKIIDWGLAKMADQDFFENRDSFYFKATPVFRGGVNAAILVGLTTLAIAFNQAEATRVWGALLFNMFFFFSIALGGVVICAMQDVIGATWGRPIRRLHEGFASFLPVAGIIMVIMFAAIKFDIADARNVYSWIKDPSLVAHIYGKGVWLQEHFMMIRCVVAIAVIIGLSRWQMNLGIKRDQHFIDGNQQKASAAAEHARDTLRYWSAPVLIAYAVLYTILCFDLLMSLSPLWFSTLWGGWLFAVMIQTLMAVSLIAMFALQNTNFGAYFGRQQFHDSGKLMHGFTVFFAYLTYAHVLTYWYGNVPEETEYFIHRLHGPWFYIVTIAPFFNFVIPLFALIFKSAKWTAIITIPLATMILIAQWATYMLIVMPDTAHAGLSFPWVELGGLALIVGLFLGSFARFGRKTPMLAIADPLLRDAISAGH